MEILGYLYLFSILELETKILFFDSINVEFGRMEWLLHAQEELR
jgi:hypothetical protein